MIALEHWTTTAIEEFVIGCVIALVGLVLLPAPVTYFFVAVACILWLRAFIKWVAR